MLFTPSFHNYGNLFKTFSAGFGRDSTEIWSIKCMGRFVLPRRASRQTSTTWSISKRKRVLFPILSLHRAAAAMSNNSNNRMLNLMQMGLRYG